MTESCGRGGSISWLTCFYLVSPKETFPTILPTTPLVFEPYREADHGRLARIIEATYEGTFDCPRLQGARDTDDVLAGYRSTGEFDPCRWLIVRHADRDVGCVLCADHPQFDNMELLYMGLIRAAATPLGGGSLATPSGLPVGPAERASCWRSIGPMRRPSKPT